MSLIVDIKKQLGNFSLETAFEAENEITCLLGASGCGKSMTLKCIAGIVKPDSGHIELDGITLYDSRKHINLTPQQRRVGYLFQNYALFPNMNVRQNIMCGMTRIKDRTEKERRLAEMLELFQLTELVKHRPSQLSGGQAQRVALARILVNEPRMLMLDEPFSALDTHLRDKLVLEMRDMMARFDHEVLMVTHSRDEAYNMSKKIAVMDRGRILQLSETKQLFADPGSIPAATLTGVKNIFTAEKAGDRAVLVPELNITLETAVPVKEGLKAIGIRAHYFNEKCPRNSFPVEYVEDMEEAFEWIVEFRYSGQEPGSQPVWWRLSKDKKPASFPEKLGIAPENILLLY